MHSTQVTSSIKQQLWCLVLVATVAWFHSTTTKSYAAWHPYEWLITIQTEEVTKIVKDASFGLAPIVKVNVSFSKLDGSESTDYEKIWFCKGKTFGIERQTSLSLGSSKTVAIKVMHISQTPSQNDAKAAAKSILRILLDLRLNGNLLQTVIVPDESFLSIRDELANEHFEIFVIPSGAPFHLTTALYLQNQSASRSQLLYYVPKRVPS